MFFVRGTRWRCRSDSRSDRRDGGRMEHKQQRSAIVTVTDERAPV
jgi:hypothetical protein